MKKKKAKKPESPSGVSRELGQKCKHCKNTEVLHLGGWPSGRQTIPGQNWTIIVATLRPWYNAEIPELPLNLKEKEQVVFLEEGPGVSKMSLALEQPQGCTGASLGLL